MRRTSLIAAAAAAVTSLIVAAAFAANTGAKGQNGIQTLKLVLKGFKFVEVRNPQATSNAGLPATGDLQVFTATVTTSSGEPMGTVRSSCSVVSGGSSRWQGLCYEAYDLRGGVIYAMTLGGGGMSNIHESIVGGTGSYADALGSVGTARRPGARPGAPVTETITLAP